MPSTGRMVAVAAIAIAAAAAGYGVNAWWRSGSSGEAASALLGAKLTDLVGVPTSIARWRGEVLIVNFWATWCAPCREEIPVFVKLQERYGARGVRFIGVAIDQRDKVESFAREFGINYPLLLGGTEAIELSRRAGNRLGALPFTVVIGRSGEIASVELGIVKESRLETMLNSLI